MYKTLYVLWHNFFQMCLFRLNPQDLPTSGALMSLLLMLYALLMGLLNLISLSPGKALLAGLTDTALLVSLTWMLLYVARYPRRLPQTLSALAGTGVVLNLFSAPLIVWLSMAQQQQLDPGLPAILLLILMGWSLGVSGHIFSHALSLNFWLGLVTAFFMALASISILETLFPLPQPQP